MVLKMILLGDPGVGKTSLVQQFVHGKFKVSYQLTVGLDVSSKDVHLKNGKVVRLSINDIGGQKRFSEIRHVFYSGAHVVMLVYDVTRNESLKSLLDVWSKELMKYNPPRIDQPSIQMVLVGNKADLEDLRMVEKEDADEIASRIGCIAHIESSAKDNVQVDEVFTTLAEAYLDNI